MKKIDKSLSGYWGAVKLYREDIEDLTELVKAFPETHGVAFQTGNYEFESLDDIVTKEPTSQELQIFRITTFKNYKSEDVPFNEGFAIIRIQSTSSSYSFLSDGPISRGLTSQIDSFMKNHQKPFQFVKWPFPLYLIIPGLGAELGAVIFVLFTHISWSILYYMFSMGVILSLPFMLFPQPKSLIVFDYRKSRPSFWQRHKEEFKVEAIKYLISAGLGFVLAVLIKKVLNWPQF